MKHELKAMVEAAFQVNGDWSVAQLLAGNLKTAFLSALHWRGDELWCGPVNVTFVEPRVDDWIFTDRFIPGVPLRSWFKTREDARNAAYANTKKHIAEWFEDQAK